LANAYDLAGKTAIVTGGAKGIGRAITERLSASGARVCVWDTSTAAFAGAHSAVVDVTQPDQIRAALVQHLSEHSRIDILVNNAGYLGPIKAFDEHQPGDWQRIIQINLVGMLQVAQAIVPCMRRAGGGRIVNMGSLAGKEGLANLAVYSAASAGVIAFTKALSREICDSDIRVNCVAPGPIDTRMIRDLGNKAVDAMIIASPLQRLGDPNEVAGLVLWLCSDAAAFNTGAVFDMSGGRARY